MIPLDIADAMKKFHHGEIDEGLLARALGLDVHHLEAIRPTHPRQSPKPSPGRAPRRDLTPAAGCPPLSQRLGNTSGGPAQLHSAVYAAASPAKPPAHYPDPRRRPCGQTSLSNSRRLSRENILKAAACPRQHFPTSCGVVMPLGTGDV